MLPDQHIRMNNNKSCQNVNQSFKTLLFFMCWLFLLQFQFSLLVPWSFFGFILYHVLVFFQSWLFLIRFLVARNSLTSRLIMPSRMKSVSYTFFPNCLSEVFFTGILSSVPQLDLSLEISLESIQIFLLFTILFLLCEISHFYFVYLVSLVANLEKFSQHIAGNFSV